MAWRLDGAKPLSEPMLEYVHICDGSRGWHHLLGYIDMGYDFDLSHHAK